MRFFVLICMLLGCTYVGAQSYNSLLIPDSLRKGSRVVVREDEMILEIKSPSKAVTKERHVYTILGESGDSWGGFSTPYDKFTAINSVSIRLYDAMGKELKHVKKKDMDDRSYTVEGTMMNDARYKQYDFNYRSYPYTVEYEEEGEKSGILYFDNWQPLQAPGVSSQHSKYVIIAPKDYEVRYKAFNTDIEPVITASGDKKIYTWELRNLKPGSRESNGPRWGELSPKVLFAPSDFEAEGYKGNMSSWANFGKFINQLRMGRDVLPAETKKKVHELTDHLSGTREKVYALYDYLQKTTHYISIQLGIGGWQPFPADYVATRLYGDCKALSNYMVALLKEAGIEGKYVVLYSGEEAPDMIEEFSSLQGNHAISCVPMGKDTIWLECTSQTVSPGYMGSSTGGRKVLVIDESGGHIVRTPSYMAKDNVQSRVVTARINEEGNLDAEVNTVYTGIKQELPHALINEVNSEQRQKLLNYLLNLPTYSVEKSNYEERKGPNPVVKEYLHVLSPNYAAVTGKRMFVSPNLFDKSQRRLSADSVRKTDFVNRGAFSDIDSIVIHVPAGYETESLPKDIVIEGRYGKFRASYRVVGDQIVYLRRQEEGSGRFPPAEYGEIVKYYEQLYKADHTSIVLVRK